jgi:Tol biopolymer transport system component
MRDSLAKNSPSLCPDGTKIAYLAAERGRLLSQAHIWVVNSDGTNAHDLTPSTGNWENTRWSPDSRFVIFDGGVEDSGAVNYQIARVNLRTANVELLTRAMSYGNRDPSYTADGQKITYLSGRIGGVNGGKVWVMNSDGSDAVPIDTSQTASAYPRPSPVRNEFLFVWGFGGESGAGSYSIELDSIALPALTSSFNYISDKYGGQFVQWSPDGNRVLFLFATSSTSSDLYLMNRDGTNVKQITNGIKIFWSPYAWSPDSKRLVFAGTDDQYKTIRVFVADLTVGKLKKLNVTHN